MEVGEYETNTLAISNIASIAFRFYRHVASVSAAQFPFSPSDVEKSLRNDGHLVFADSRRNGIWCFRLLRKDGSAIGSPTKSELNATIDVGPYKLTTVSEGAFDPSSLVLGKPASGTNANPINTPNSSASSSANSTALHTSFGLSVLPGAVDVPSSQSTSASSGQDGEVLQNGGSIQPSQGPQGQQTSEPRSAFPPVPTKVVYNFFMSAVLASLSTAYCSHAKAIALNNRTFLLPPLDPLWDGNESSRTDSRSLVATLRITLTTAGSLLVGLSHSLLRGMGCSEWECYAGVPPPGSAVLTAPWGKFATVQDAYPPIVSADDGRYALARLKRNGVPLPAVPHGWKSFVSKMLEMRGTSASVLQDSTWLQLEFVLDDEPQNGDSGNQDSVVILWPSVLCFWCLEDSLVTVAPFQKLDPLADLREAYLEELRAEEAASRPKEAGKDEDGAAEDVVMEDVQTVSSIGKGTQSDGPSPLGVRHPLGPGSGTAATKTIYPTPPDGLLGIVGQTPTFDGSTSSPGNLAGTSAPVDLEAASGPEGEIWPNISARQDEQDQPFMGEPDNLLGGDLGADMFGDDITDADFNFFDDTKQADGANAAAAMAGPSSGASAPALVSDKMDVDFSGQNEPASASTQPDSETQSAAQTDTNTEATPQIKTETPSMPPPPPPPAPSQQPPTDGETSAETASKPSDSAVFTKPELRHARSNLVDSRKSGSKRSPSPFNAMTVFKRVRAIAEANKGLPVGAARQALPPQPGKLFEGLKFTEFMIQNNKKYELNGKFGFSWPHPEADMQSDLSSATSPTAFRRPLKKPPGLSDSSPQFATLISSITRGLKSSSLHSATAATSPLLLEDSGDTSSNSSSSSSSSEDSDDDEAPLAVTAVHRKMRARAMAEFVPSPEAAKGLSLAYSEGVWDFPIARFFAEPLPPPNELNYADDDIVDVAQILTQQITHATIRSVYNEDDGQDLQKSKLRQTLLQRIRYSVATLEDSLPASLDGASRCALKPYLDVPDALQLAPPGRLHPRAPPGSDQRIPNLFPAPTPLVGIRRNESTLSIKPTGIEFWEVLGLEPLHGPKDIRAVCAYPNYQGLSHNVSGFLNRMKIVYESLRLGSHELLSSKASVVDGMVAFNSDLSSSSASVPGAEYTGVDQVHKLAQALAAEDTPGKSLVVYFVYCPDITTAIVDACLAFQRLAQLYEIAVTSRSSEPNDLVLQLIPSDFLSSPTSLAVPTPTDLLYLSLEVYDRCASPQGPKPAPAFLLEQPPARNLDLKLSSTPIVDVQRENSCIHVAYAVSADERWITAAWTDGSGWRQFSSAYWVGRKDSDGATNSFDAVAREIWTNTCAIVSNLKVHWRAIVAKCGQMDPEEISIWSDLSKAETRASMSLTLVSVDTQPALELLPPVITVAPTVLSQLSVQTMAQTPQASVFSPEQSGNPVTPAGGFGNPTTPAGTTPAGGAPTPATPGGQLGKAGAPNSPAIPSTPSAGGANAGNNANAAANASANANAANNDASAKLAAAGADPNTVADIEGNVVLVDVTDNTWIAVAAHRLNTASTWVDLRPALVSGYLIKRGGIGRDDAPVVLEVNIVHVDAKHRASDALARDILTSYRSLGTLARVRGILDSERDARPWHIAAAERAARALCKWM